MHQDAGFGEGVACTTRHAREKYSQRNSNKQRLQLQDRIQANISKIEPTAFVQLLNNAPISIRLATGGASSLTRLRTVAPPYAKSPKTMRVSLELLMSRKDGLVCFCFSSLLRSQTRTLASVDCLVRHKQKHKRRRP